MRIAKEFIIWTALSYLVVNSYMLNKWANTADSWIEYLAEVAEELENQVVQHELRITVLEQRQQNTEDTMTVCGEL